MLQSSGFCPQGLQGFPQAFPTQENGPKGKNLLKVFQREVDQDPDTGQAENMIPDHCTKLPFIPTLTLEPLHSV